MLKHDRSLTYIDMVIGSWNLRVRPENSIQIMQFSVWMRLE